MGEMWSKDLQSVHSVQCAREYRFALHLRAATSQIPLGGLSFRKIPVHKASNMCLVHVRGVCIFLQGSSSAVGVSCARLLRQKWIVSQQALRQSVRIGAH